ncbi:hypothetical protein C4J81_11375 [Deltaproteobacteria bacterium Smac51]|nr:hypothetical protein C4J81_11375 [Deltaproteobacteria bacterium Smac51]
MKLLRFSTSVKYGLILLAICYIYFIGAAVHAQAPDEHYERRAQEVIAGLMRLNGLLGWDPVNPSTWPPASFNLNEDGDSGGSINRQAVGVSFTQTTPARLTGLRLANLGLTRVADFSGLDALMSLEVPGNSLRSLNLAGDTALRRLTAMKNQLTGLDVRHCGELLWLAASGNRLGKLDLSGNPLLRELSVSMNQLGGLDVSANPQLTVLEAMNNQLSELTVERNPNLARLLVSYNQLDELFVGRNPELVELGARDNNLRRLDLSANSGLRELTVSRNRLTDLDLSLNPRLETLLADQNSLPILDLSANPELETVQISQNPLVEVRLGDNRMTRLRNLNVEGCRLPLSRLHHLSGLAKSRGRLGTQEDVLFEERTIELKDGLALLDLSSEAVIGGEPTTFLALNEKRRRLRPSDYRVENGIIVFFKPGLYVVMMTNPKVFSSEINQLTGRVHEIKAKAYTGVIEVAGPTGGDGQDL